MLMMIDPTAHEMAPAVSTAPRITLLFPVRESTSGICTLFAIPRKMLARNNRVT